MKLSWLLQERILSLQAEKEVAELQECTFRPIINPSSTRMIAERNLSITKQARLKASSRQHAELLKGNSSFKAAASGRNVQNCSCSAHVG